MSAENKNWFQMMETGVYNIIVDRMALYEPSAIESYRKGYQMSNTGEMVATENEIVQGAVTILGMIDIDKRGYSFALVNKNMSKEIVEILYNHISVCIDYKNKNPLNEYPVPLEDLIDMETFMMKVLKNNPKQIIENFTETLEYRLKTSSMNSIFDRPTEIEARESPEDKYKRVTKKNSPYFGLNLDDILNDA